jgi:hypothetical protein
MHTARPPMSDGSGGINGDDFSVWATSMPPALGPPENDKDDPMPSIPRHRSDPSTACAACLPMSGGGGGVDGDDFGVWAMNMPPPLGPPMLSIPPPVQPLDHVRRLSTYEWRQWWRRRWCRR